jgi:mannose-6-phosphate isomerase-like protein (cupin superfamily)
MQVVNLAKKFGMFGDYWAPKIVGDLNEMQVKLVKLRGEFVWHHHDEEDELFLVVQGRLRMQLREGDREVGPGEFIIVPRKVEHCPLSLTDEVHVVLLEPKTTLNTGNVRNERTLTALERL